jgi:hypothetical protein
MGVLGQSLANDKINSTLQLPLQSLMRSSQHRTQKFEIDMECGFSEPCERNPPSWTREPRKAVAPASVENGRSSPGAALLTAFGSTAGPAEGGSLSAPGSTDETSLPTTWSTSPAGNARVLIPRSTTYVENTRLTTTWSTSSAERACLPTKDNTHLTTTLSTTWAEKTRLSPQPGGPRWTIFVCRSLGQLWRARLRRLVCRPFVRIVP